MTKNTDFPSGYILGEKEGQESFSFPDPQDIPEHSHYVTLPQTKLYQGLRTPAGVKVSVNGEPLYDVSGIGFDWGDIKAKTQNLAHSMLYDFYQSESMAITGATDFKFEVLNHIHSDKWKITNDGDGWIIQTFYK